MLNLTLRQLRTFAVAARHLSFARAAEELHLTPPAVSMQIRDLEHALNFPVFERTGKTVALTPVGEYMLVSARRVLAVLRETEDNLARLRGLKTGRVVIGTVSTAEYFLPRMLVHFRDQHPGVEVRLMVGNRQQLIQWLRDRDVDLAVMGRPPRELEARAEMFAPHPLGIIAPPSHPLARRGQINPAELAEESFIVREAGSGTRMAMEQFFRDHHIAPPTIMEMAGNETIKQAVIANMGLALLSLHTVGLERKTGLLVALDVAGMPLMRAWHLVNIASAGLSPAAEAFRYFVLEHGSGLLEAQFGVLTGRSKSRHRARASGKPASAPGKRRHKAAVSPKPRNR